MHAPGAYCVAKNFIYISEASPAYPLIAMQYTEFSDIDMSLLLESGVDGLRVQKRVKLEQ